ncbi:hypothetical protein AAG570_011662 [Ranatra chinensis]|uniref:Uncharacterized protein n=1 Tax=Ranatra chinensis TaxID=642074 RepID=A0ABD0YII1_9HEMI
MESARKRLGMNEGFGLEESALLVLVTVSSIDCRTRELWPYFTPYLHRLTSSVDEARPHRQSYYYPYYPNLPYVSKSSSRIHDYYSPVVSNPLQHQAFPYIPKYRANSYGTYSDALWPLGESYILRNTYRDGYNGTGSSMASKGVVKDSKGNNSTDKKDKIDTTTKKKTRKGTAHTTTARTKVDPTTTKPMTTAGPKSTVGSKTTTGPKTTVRSITTTRVKTTGRPKSTAKPKLSGHTTAIAEIVVPPRTPPRCGALPTPLSYFGPHFNSKDLLHSSGPVTGQPCSFEGNWRSESLNINFLSEATHGSSLIVRSTPTSGAKEMNMVLNPKNWRFKGETSFDILGPISITGFNTAEQMMTVFVGFCRAYNEVDTTTGTWVIGRSARDFSEAHIALKIVQDIMRKESSFKASKNKG